MDGVEGRESRVVAFSREIFFKCVALLVRYRNLTAFQGDTRAT